MKPSDFIKSVELRESNDFAKIAERFQDHGTIRLVHAMIGMCTESAEIQDQMKKHLMYGKDIDRTNLIEELGDLMWYIGLACSELGVSLEKVMEINNAKLAARYGDVFTEQAALERNLNKERAILEDGSDDGQDN
jgi:NTP pyrophosphatase (non-canonical NTP hydrolase)